MITEVYNLDINVIFSQKIRKLVDQSGLTRAAFGEKVGVTETTVQRWIKGENSPKLSKINEIADIFNIHPQELLGISPVEMRRDELLLSVIDTAQKIRSISGLQAALEAIDAICEGESLAQQENLLSGKKKA